MLPRRQRGSLCASSTFPVGAAFSWHQACSTDSPQLPPLLSCALPQSPGALLPHYRQQSLVFNTLLTLLVLALFLTASSCSIPNLTLPLTVLPLSRHFIPDRSAMCQQRGQGCQQLMANGTQCQEEKHGSGETPVAEKSSPPFVCPFKLNESAL